jgi:anaerobic ribonucleoside-triphosphate reductase activating protein
MAGDHAHRLHSLRIARIAERARTLGPGARTVIWVQGCPLRCFGCLAPEALPLQGGKRVDTTALAEQILAITPAVDGVTYSGGEPFSQSEGLLDLSERLRSARPNLSLMAFTGYTMRWLLARGEPAQKQLLDSLDLLIDGPYVQALHASLRWRGSTNQRLHRLTGRHHDRELEPDESAGVEIEVQRDASVGFVGVPPIPGFRAAIAASLHDGGLVLQ